MILFLSITFLIGAALLTIIGNVLFWSKVKPTEKIFPHSVSVLIPARNEKENLVACVNSVLLQGTVVKEILVYNDHSTDGTDEIIDQLRLENAHFHNIEVNPLPAGWCGKNYACAQLAKSATGAWLLFLDADARLSPNAINRMIQEAISREVTFLSCWPRLEMISLAEKLLMPMLNFVVFSIFPGFLSLLKDKQFSGNPSLGIAHGSCMFFEKDSYFKFGGHERVKDQIFEDTRIAQLWREDRQSGVCLDGQDVVSLRMYKSWQEIWSGFQKNFYPAFRKDQNFWLFILFHFALFFVPFLLVIFLDSKWQVAIWLIYLCRFALALRFNHSIISILFHPVSELFLLILGISSYLHCKSGRGVQWKGRAYLNRT